MSWPSGGWRPSASAGSTTWPGRWLRRWRRRSSRPGAAPRDRAGGCRSVPRPTGSPISPPTCRSRKPWPATPPSPPWSTSRRGQQGRGPARTGHPRPRADHGSDTLVERLTGQATARDVTAEIQILVPVEALVDHDNPLPAEIPGHGPVPVDLLTGGAGRKTWRRLVTRDGTVIGGDSRSRFFTGRLAALIRARDGHRCREPYCDAPIRHIDHIRRWSDLGRTEFDNGRGLCAFHNHVRETVGWRAEVTAETITTTTPTGVEYVSEIPSTNRSGFDGKSRPGAA